MPSFRPWSAADGEESLFEDEVPRLDEEFELDSRPERDEELGHDEELRRYERQVRIFGEEGQEALKRSTVFIVGAGGLGSAVSIYLAAAGIGHLIVADGDVVEKSNLNRQILHGTKDIGRSKSFSAENALQDLNPEIRVEAIEDFIDEDNLMELTNGADLIVDALDNFSARYILNLAVLAKNVPLFHGAISGYNGQATTIIPGKTACLRCLFPRAPPKRTSPALGATCGVIGSIQALEVVKYLTSSGDLLENRLLIWDGARAKMDEVAIERNPECPDCKRSQANFK